MIGCLLDTGPLVTLAIDPSRNMRGSANSCAGYEVIGSSQSLPRPFISLQGERKPGTASSFLPESATEVYDAFAPAALSAIVRLMAKYADRPMDFADATLVWLAEQTGTDRVLTLDRRGFQAYRYGRSRRFHLILDA